MSDWYQDYQRRYERLRKLFGKGRKGYFLIGILFVTFFSSYSLLVATVMSDNQAILVKVCVVMGVIGLVLTSIASLRLRYWRDIFIWQLAGYGPVVVIHLLVGYALLLEAGWFSTQWIIVSSLVVLGVAVRMGKRYVQGCELAYQKGLLRRHLFKEVSLEYVTVDADSELFYLERIIAKAEKREKEYINKLRRLEKLAFLLPSIVTAFRRASGHDETIYAGVFMTIMGLVFMSQLVIAFLMIRKIREWESEIGKPMLLQWD